MKVDVLELFSGIGGFSKGLQEAGFEIQNHYFSEVDKHAIANYKYNFKNAQYVESVTNVQYIIERVGANRTNKLFITFGSPCQDFSLAGKREGFEGTKSSLIKYAIILIERLRPDIFIWENVKGAYSTNDGADYWAIIQAFANLDGYRHEQQLFNTSWFLPQNRERIYSVGYIATGCRGGIFPIGKNDVLFNQAKESESRWSQAKHNSTTLMAGNMKVTDSFISSCLAPGTSGGMNADATYIEVKSNTNKGFEELTKNDSLNFSVPKSKTRRGRVGKGKAQTLDTACNIGVIDTIQDNQFPNSRNILEYSESSPTITSKSSCLSVNNIRRLTEIECERLQGFPDDWTKFGIYEKIVWTNKKLKTFSIIEGLCEVTKTQRYKMCGNAVTVAVVKEIGLRLKESIK